MNIFEVLQNLGGGVWLYGGAFVLVLSILVFVHEWGHYIVARMFGVRVDAFSIGFGREIFGFTDSAGTRWKFSLIPLGGYVKMFGDVDPASAHHDESVEDGEGGETREMTQAERSQAFFAKPVWQRALIVFAGPGINYLFAIILMALLFSFNGKPVTPPIASAVMEGSSAERNGFEPHDLVVSIDGKTINSFEDIRREMMISLDDERHFVVEREGRLIDIFARPDKVTREDRFGFQHSKGLLGLVGPRNAVLFADIVSVNGEDVSDPEAAQTLVQQAMNDVMRIGIRRGEEVEVLIVKPEATFNPDMLAGTEPEPAEVLFLYHRDSNILLRYNFFTSIGKATQESWEITAGTLKALGQMIMGTRSATELGGVVRIGAIAGDMAQQGFVALVLFTALLSINLGLINLFPIPLLDGGHLLFYAFEALLGKPIPEHIQEYAFRFGLAFLVGVMLFANINDLVQLFL